ncbi:MAG: hypothetical protein Q7T44_17485 [Parvibaculum sp.]|nr:hypothetical protein [Parvibaculum sp.]
MTGTATQPKFSRDGSPASFKVSYLEIVGSNVSNGELTPGGRFWSVDETARAVPFDVRFVVCARRDRAYVVN